MRTQELELQIDPPRTASPRDFTTRKLLLIAYCFPPSPAPGATRAWRLYRYLPEFGYETHVITASPPDRVLPHVNYVPLPAVSLTERVLRKFVFPGDEGVLWTSRAIIAAEQLLGKTRFDAVLSTYPFVHDHRVAFQLKKRFSLAWIADYRDSLVGGPFRSATGLPGFVSRFLNRQFFGAADLLVCVTDSVREDWLRQNPEVAGKVVVIWNGYDPEENIGPRPIPPGGPRVVSHVGNFYGGRSPEVALVSALRMIRRGIVDPSTFRFRFIGYLDSAIWMANKALFEELSSLGCLQCQATVPRPEALKAMMESDELLLVDTWVQNLASRARTRYNNASGTGYTVPAKLFEYIRIGRPILALTVDNSPVHRLLKMSGVPFVTLSPDLDEKTIDRRMVEFLTMPNDPVGVSEEFLTTFNGRNQARTLAGLIDKILTSSLRRQRKTRQLFC